MFLINYAALILKKIKIKCLIWNCSAINIERKEIIFIKKMTMQNLSY